jgi:hypothetical protein
VALSLRQAASIISATNGDAEPLALTTLPYISLTMAAGSVILNAFTVGDNGSIAVPSTTDTKAQSYTGIGSVLRDPADSQLLYCSASPNVAAGATVVNANLNVANGYWRGLLAEISGADPTSPIGSPVAVQAGTTSSGGMTLSPITPTKNGNWIVAYWVRHRGREPGPDELDPLTRAYWDAGRRVRAADYLLAIGDLQKFSRTVATFLSGGERGGVDLWLTPTMSQPPARIGEIRKRIAEATPGPWAADRIGTESSRVGRAGMVARQVYCAHHGDAALIASAPADLAWLCDEVERLAGERDTARDHAIDAVREEMDEEVRAMLDGATGDRDFFKQPPPGTSPWQTQLFLRAAEWSDSLRSEVERLTAELAKRDEED